MNSEKPLLVTCIILAGGLSTRFGSHKALHPLGGKPLIMYVLEVVEPLCQNLMISTNSPEKFDFITCPCVPDIYKTRGPIGGIHAGLLHSPTDDCLVIACDLPNMNRDLLEAILARRNGYQAVVPLNRGVPEPLVIYLHKGALPAFEEAIRQHRYRMSEVLNTLKCHYFEVGNMSFYSPSLFLNVNRMTDLEQVQNTL